MLRARTVVLVAGLALAGVVDAQAQGKKNPFEGDPAAVKTGMGLFRARCADCHGIDAKGIRGPDLTQVWNSGRSDEGLFQTLRTGVLGTEMPAVGDRTPDDEVWKILAYLRTVAAAPANNVPGDAQKGERIFRIQCSSCHRNAQGRGGRLGPDLSRVGISRARAVVVRRIRGAVEDSLTGFEPVTITTKDGQTITGVKKNEDMFSVQIMDSRERIQGYVRSDVRQVENTKQSAMPAFPPERLSENDLNDLLAYLSTFKGYDPAVK
ncbi:MAG: c-type cytochrome [Vicinamibacterales bacterium]